MRAPAITRRTALMLAAVAALGASACNRGAEASGGAGDAVTVIGQASAPVTVTEYASVTCGACAAWDEQIWPKFKAKYVDTGLVKFELREMLTPPNQVSAAGWLVARCAPADRRFAVVEQIYRSQPEMLGGGDPRAVLQRIAAQAGMNQQQFEACVTNEEAALALNERVEAAVERGVQGTPAFFINGKQHQGGITLEAFDAALKPLVAGKKAG